MKFKPAYLLPILVVVLCFTCSNSVLGQTKSTTTNKTQAKAKTPTKKTSGTKAKAKPAKKGVKSKPLKYMGKEAKKAVNDVKKEL